jgi:hypothetical protein
VIRTIKHRRQRIWIDQTSRYEVRGLFEKYINREVKFKRKFLAKTYTKSRSTRYKNICYLSGKARGILLNGFSRHGIKTLGTQGLWFSLRKASW